MKNKNTLIILGAVALAGVGIFFWNKNRKQKTAKMLESINSTQLESSKPMIDSIKIGDSDVEIKPIGSMIQTVSATRKPAVVNTVSEVGKNDTIKLSKFELESRMLKLCGVQPLYKQGAKYRLYNECLMREKEKLRNQGLISFEGYNMEKQSSVLPSSSIQDEFDLTI